VGSVGTSLFSKKRKKKGLSPVVASVLLILLVIVLATLIFLWARGFISEQIEKHGQPVEQLCSAINFEAEYYPEGGGGLQIVNRGDTAIYSFEVKVYEGGNTYTEQFEFPLSPGASDDGPLTLDLINADYIEIYPVLIGGVRGRDTNKAYTCTEHGKKINI